MSALILAAQGHWVHALHWASWTPAQFPVPDPSPQPPPGSEKIVQILGWLKWAAAAAIVAVFLSGFVAAAAGHVTENHRSGRTGARLITAALGLALLYGVGYGVITAVSG